MSILINKGNLILHIVVRPLTRRAVKDLCLVPQRVRRLYDVAPISRDPGALGEREVKSIEAYLHAVPIAAC